MGKLLIIVGIVFILAGLWILYLPRIPFLGKLPGDILVKRNNFSFFFPLGTSIVLSVVLSLVFYLLSWIFRR